jgi:NAD(P)-dependent dehydrogenase (short-subunit alcohol dehydrogenase family)
VEVHELDASVEAHVAAFFSKLERFDHLVSTASQSATGRLSELKTAAIEQAFAAKLWAPVHLIKHGAPRISASGSFTFFSGFRSERPSVGSSITSLVNGGLEAFVRAMAVEFAPVRVNAVSPGIVDSGTFWERLGHEAREKLFADFARLSPGRHVGHPDELAAASLFCMTNSFLTASVIPVDGGARLM